MKFYRVLWSSLITRRELVEWAKGMWNKDRRQISISP